jgi:hypothetical protein
MAETKHTRIARILVLSLGYPSAPEGAARELFRCGYLVTVPLGDIVGRGMSASGINPDQIHSI